MLGLIIVSWTLLSVSTAESPYSKCKILSNVLDCTDVNFQPRLHHWRHITYPWLQSINTLIFRRNSLGALYGDGTLASFSHLKSLKLEENSINHIADYFFASLQNITELSLHHNSLITVPAAVKNLKNLKHLDLSYNNLSVFGSEFIQMSKLKNLSLSGNQHILLPKDSFAGLSSLQELYLNDLQITRLPDNIFKNSPILNHLELRSSFSPRFGLTFKQVKDLPLRKIDISENIFKCDCDALWIWHEIHNISRHWNHNISGLHDSGHLLKCYDPTVTSTVSYEKLVNHFCTTVQGWSVWTIWTDCTSTCDVGRTERKRICYGGTTCVGESAKITSCKISDCPVLVTTDGSWSLWASWSGCTGTCDEGRSIRERFCDNPVPQNGGRSCVGESVETRSCNTKDCPIMIKVIGVENGDFTEWPPDKIERIIDKALGKRHTILIIVIICSCLMVVVYLVCVFVRVYRKNCKNDVLQTKPIVSYESSFKEISASTKRFLKDPMWFSRGNENKGLPPMPFMQSLRKDEGFEHPDGRYIKARPNHGDGGFPIPPTRAENVYEEPSYAFIKPYNLTKTCFQQKGFGDSSRKGVQFDSHDEVIYDENMYLLPTDRQSNSPTKTLENHHVYRLLPYQEDLYIDPTESSSDHQNNDQPLYDDVNSDEEIETSSTEHAESDDNNDVCVDQPMYIDPNQLNTRK